MYKACSVSNVNYFVVGGTDCDSGNMQQMVQQPAGGVWHEAALPL